MPKNSRILIISIIIGILFSTAKINATRIHHDEILLKGQISTNQNKNIKNTKIPIFLKNSKKEELSKENKKLYDDDNHNLNNPHSKHYVEKNDNFDNDTLFNDSLTLNLEDEKEEINDTLFNDSLTLNLEDEKEEINDTLFNNSLTLNLEDEKEINKLVNLMDGNKDNSLFCAIDKKINKNNKHFKKIVEQYKDAKDLEQINEYEISLLLIDEKYENINTFIEDMKNKEKLNIKSYNKLRGKLRNSYSEFLEKVNSIEIKKIDICNKILTKIKKKYENSEKLENFENEIKMILININDTYHLSFKHYSISEEDKMSKKYKKLCRNYINLQTTLISRKIKIANDQITKFSKLIKNKCQRNNKEKYYYYFLEQMNIIKNSLKNTVDYLTSESYNEYYDIKNYLLNNFSKRKKLLELLKDLQNLQIDVAEKENKIMYNISIMYLNKLEHLKKSQPEFQKIYNKQEMKELEENLTRIDENLAYQIKILSVIKNEISKQSSNLSKLSKILFESNKINNLNMYIMPIAENTENINNININITPDTFKNILEIKEFLNKYEKVLNDNYIYHWKNSTTTYKNKLNKNLKNKKTSKNLCIKKIKNNKN